MAQELAVAGPRRPFAVWSIFLFYIVATLWTVLGFVLIYAGIVPLNEAQKAYFANLSIFDRASTMVLGVTNIAAAFSYSVFVGPPYLYSLVRLY